MTDEERFRKLEEAILLMKDLVIRPEQRLDENQIQSKATREDFEFKLNALIDSQIRTESEIIETKEPIIELRNVSQSYLQRIENLEKK